MNKPNNFRFLVSLGFVLALAGALFAQSTPNKILIVNGKTAGEQSGRLMAAPTSILKHWPRSLTASSRSSPIGSY